MATPATGNVEKIISVKFDARQAISGLASLNSQIEQNTEDLKQMADAGKKGTKAYADLEQETKSLKTQKRDLSQMVQNEIKQQTTLDGSLRSLRAELSNLTKRYDALSKAERENVDVGVKLKNQINQVTNEIKRAEEGTQRYYRNVGNYQNAILGALGINGRFANSLMGITAAEGGVKGALASMGTSVKAFGASLTALLANPVFLAIAGIAGAGMAFKWFYDYNVEIEHAMRLTREFTGVTGSELQHLRAEIQATASTYGKEYQEVLEGVDLLMANFHLTSEEAIRTLNDGFMIGADINGEYLSLLKQYGPIFKDMGYSASEVVALIQQTRSGIFSEKGLEAIKQASARLREMSSNTRASLTAIGIDVDKLQQQMQSGDMVGAIQTVTDRLKTLNGNTQEYGNVMADVFGRQGKFSSQEMIESLGDIDTNLQNLKESAGEYGQAMDENQQATADLEEEAAKMFGAGENGWETVKTRADTYWKQALANAIKQTRNLLGRFAEMGKKSKVFRTVAQVVAGAVWGMTGVIVDMFRAIGAGFKAIGSWIDAFVNTFKSAFGIIKDLGRGVGDILSGNVSKGIDEISSGLSKGITNALNGLNTALKDTVNIGKAATTGFRNAYNAMGNFFDNYKPTPAGAEGSWGDEDPDTKEDTTNNNNNNNNNNNSRGSRSRGSRSTAPKKASTSRRTTTPKETPEQKAAREAEEAFVKKMNALNAEGEKFKMKALQERAKTEAKAIDELAEAQRQDIIKKYGTLEELQARLAKATTEEDKQLAQGAIDGYNALMADVEKQRSDAITKMIEESTKARKEAEAKAAEDAKQLAQNLLAGTTEGTAKWLDYQLELIRMEKEAELALYEGNEQMKAAIVAKYAKMESDARRSNSQAQIAIEQEKYTAIAGIMGGLGEVMGAFGEDQKEWVVLQKTLALAEIAINQGVAISAAVKNAATGSFTVWQMIAQIATGITAVTTAMVGAFKALDSAKFATGGYIRGAGTGTSDSIPVRVSNGESIMNANTTAMFGGLLSSLNQLGGGVPIQVQQTATSVRGEDMLARAVARGVAMLPAPVVSVEDINKGQRQVIVMNERASI